MADSVPILILYPALSISAYLAWIDKYFNIDKQYRHYVAVTSIKPNKSRNVLDCETIVMSSDCFIKIGI